MRRILKMLLALALVLWYQDGLAWSGQAEHVVVVVWDGMRPDFVSAQYTPVLNELAGRGTFFKNHHSSYITSTEVNGTAIAAISACAELSFTPCSRLPKSKTVYVATMPI